MDVPFVDFYNQNQISPVRQDISDLRKHFCRRRALYQILGLPPALVESKSVIEFGPGSGHNAVYTSSLSPGHYTLVDASEVGVKALGDRFGDSRQIRVCKSLFEEHSSEFLFDVVLAENCVPHQPNPVALLTHISSFTKKGGVFIHTTINGISYLSETLRRLIRDKLGLGNLPVTDQVRALTPVYTPHLSTLKAMSRSVEDWILDSVVQPLNKVSLLSIPDAIEALKGEFDFYNSSPSFRSDWRWYKELTEEEKGFNALALEQYFRKNINLIDYRFTLPDQTPELGLELEVLCGKTWKIMCAIENGDPNWSWKDLFENLSDISEKIEPLLPETAAAIVEIRDWLETGDPDAPLVSFTGWWGRGAQYVSFLRK
jgi:SAM-dependent methyltransferase